MNTALPERPEYPFWGWGDAAMFLSLSIPSLLLSAALSHGLFLLMPFVKGEGPRLIVLQFMAYGIWFAALWLMLKFRYGRPFWQSMAWVVPWPGMKSTIWIGPALVIAVVLLGEALHTPQIDNKIQRLLQDRLSVIMIGFFASTLGPLAEELVFRGFLLPLLIRSIGVVAGMTAASLPFALLHGPQYDWSWRHILLLFLASLVFSLVRWRTGSTAASTLVHATYNLTFFTGFLLQRKDLLN